jgi:hypothetical protein
MAWWLRVNRPDLPRVPIRVTHADILRRGFAFGRFEERRAPPPPDYQESLHVAGKVLAVTEIEDVTQHGDRIALEGQPLAAGRSLYDAYIGRPDPLANQSQNSITYGSLPEEGPFRIRPCGCGCGCGQESRTRLRARPRAGSYPGRASASTSAGQLWRSSSGSTRPTRTPRTNPPGLAGPQAALSGLQGLTRTTGRASRRPGRTVRTDMPACFHPARAPSGRRIIWAAADSGPGVYQN